MVRTKQIQIEELRTEIIHLKLTRPYDPAIAGKLLKLDQLIEHDRK